MIENVLSINNAFYSYTHQPDYALKDFSLDIEPGMFISLAGPNGAGKSTILKIAAGILEPEKGHILFSGKKLHSYPKKELAKRIAFLPQDVSEWYDIKVSSLVLQGRYPYLKGFGFATAQDTEICGYNMKICGVYEFKDRYISSLSGGEKQRVRLASVLSQQPDVLILDEPTASLDIHNERDLFTILLSLTQKKTSVLIATHNVNLAALFSHEIVLMSKGRIIKRGKPADVITTDNITRIYGKGFGVNIHPDSEKPFIYPFKPKGEA